MTDLNMIKIIDAHIHLWDPYTTPRTVTPVVKLLGRFPSLVRWLIKLVTAKATVEFMGEVDYVIKPYLPALYLSETGKYRDNMRGVVHIQADWHGKKAVDAADETRWLDSLQPKPLAMIGEAHLNDGENLEAVLDAHSAASPNFRGIRDMLASHPSKTIHQWNKSSDTMKTDQFGKGYQRLGERGLTFDAYIYSNQLLDFCDLVEAIPTTKVVVDHVATPVALMGPFGDVGKSEAERAAIKEEWYEGLSRLAEAEHVRLKLSGLFMPVVGWNYQNWSQPLSVQQIVDVIGPHIRFAIETFGVERCMFATNFPLDRALIPFERYYDAYFKIVATMDAGREAKQKLFHDNAAEFYNIGP